MYQITVHRIFAASHAIRLYDGSLEPLHGHNWPVEVTVAADELDAMETVMDFHVIERALDELLAQVHNKHLNDVDPFKPQNVNPSAERVAWWIGREMTRCVNQVSSPEASRNLRLVSVRVGEAPGCFATFFP